MDRYQRNKFYIGSNAVLDKDWGSPTLEHAIGLAKDRVAKTDCEVFVVKIIKVVRRARPPIDVIDVE